MCSVALFTFPPGRRLLIDSGPARICFGSFLSVCFCVCVCVCVCVCEMPYHCSDCVCVCVCVEDALSLPTLTGLCRPEILTNPMLVRAVCNVLGAHTMRCSCSCLYKKWMNSCFCVFLCTKTLCVGGSIPISIVSIPKWVLVSDWY